MTSSFDIAAASYDENFTHSLIGSLQRKFVYRHLSTLFETTLPQTVLEINCGTGEDAIWLSNQNISVTASDISSKMIGIAKSKASRKVDFRIGDINSLSADFQNCAFDMIFSNFGGLNCLSETELHQFFRNASQIIPQNGKLVLVIMPKNTVWEKIYFAAKFQLKSVFRRRKSALLANVDGVEIPVYYHNPKRVARLASHNFEVQELHPIGLFVPPSYLEPVFKSKTKLVSILEKLESTITNASYFAKYADHYLIVLTKK